MNNLQKFNNTIEGLEEELIKLKDTSEAYQKLQGLITLYGQINEQFAKNSKSLEEFATQQQQQQEELAKSLTLLHDENKIGQNEIKVQNERFEKNLSSLIKRLRQENRNFYVELERTIKINLDENKSEIKTLIENERYRIKEIFEIELSKRTAEILSKQNSLQRILWIIGLALIILNVIIMTRLF